MPSLIEFGSKSRRKLAAFRGEVKVRCPGLYERIDYEADIEYPWRRHVGISGFSGWPKSIPEYDGYPDMLEEARRSGDDQWVSVIFHVEAASAGSAARKMYKTLARYIRKVPGGAPTDWRQTVSLSISSGSEQPEHHHWCQGIAG